MRLLVTDHHALCLFIKKKDLARRLSGWSLQIQEFNIEVVHLSGKLHLDADTLSYCPVGGVEAIVDLPMLWACG